MPATLELESTLTDRYQTTVPAAVRRALGVGKRERIRYRLLPDGSVQLQAAHEVPDPTLGAFLDFLAADVVAHPRHLAALDAGLAKRLKLLAKGSKVNLDEALDPANE